jgi:hydroxymethylpyrimidine/phosphomethylpyrimidine kinase
MSSAPPVVLSFAASDPTCGAGVQADILTIAALGCVPVCVVTAITVQDTRGVQGVLPVQSKWVDEQARRLLDDVHVSAFKLGVMGSPENVQVISRILGDYADIPVVFDPVLNSGRGDPLASDDTAQALLELIVPHTCVATPNILEAARLGGVQRLLELGSQYVLVTGTHAATGEEVVNLLHDRTGLVREDRWARLPGEYHGSGCTLASAIAASLSQGRGVPHAVREAQEFTWQALAGAHLVGRGQSIPNRFFLPRSPCRG